MSAFRLKARDRDRLDRAAADRGLPVSAYLRGLILDALDADLDAGPAPME